MVADIVIIVDSIVGSFVGSILGLNEGETDGVFVGYLVHLNRSLLLLLHDV